ncbi:hypothetical protein AB0H45_12275 [Streptomyces atroolivaceus]
MTKDPIGLPEVDKDWDVPYQPADFLGLDHASIPLTGKSPASHWWSSSID